MNRKDINIVFGVPTRAETEPYNVIPVDVIIKDYKSNLSVWWCRKCNDFHTSTWNCVKAFVGHTPNIFDENTKLLLEEIKKMITTKTGDNGTTSIGSGRIKKASCLIKSLGSVDALSTYIGLAKVRCDNVEVTADLTYIQNELSDIGAILSKSGKDLAIISLDNLIKKYDNNNYYQEFYIPGSNLLSAQLDQARAECRKTEIVLWEAFDNKEFDYQEILVFMNRLSDVLWLLARKFGNKEEIKC